jgi:hypothetical protein
MERTALYRKFKSLGLSIDNETSTKTGTEK